MSNSELAARFFLQIAVILTACRVVGVACRRLGQPQVMGEIIAGVLLGPSLLGLVAPAWQSWLFPRSVAGSAVPHPLMAAIYCLAQVGVVLYMFLVGSTFRADLARARFRTAASVSLAGIAGPFLLGGLLVWALWDRAPLFSDGVKLSQAILFMGAAMSITALPVLARILDEQRLSGTPLAALALSAGAINDAAAWCLLAIVLASLSGATAAAVVAIGGSVAYVLLVVLLVRPVMRPAGRRADRTGGVSTPVFAAVIAMLMYAAWATDAIGVHAVFGAFVLGVAMPAGAFSEDLHRRVEPLTSNLLLPVFFVYSGLNTKLGLLNSAQLWAVTGLILFAACVGKGVACWLAARLNRESRRDAVAIGALMNARGLMELIILNIGYESGLITQTLFSMMVIMAIATTLMATPIFEVAFGKVGSTKRAQGTV